MKKLSIFILLFVALLLLNANSAKAFNFINLPQNQVTNEAIENDPDWILIADANDWILGKFAEAKVDPNTVDFNNKEAFLAMINVSESEYSAKHKEAKEAAKRLIDKYDLKNSKDCSTCNQSEDDIINNVKKIAHYCYSRPGDVGTVGMGSNSVSKAKCCSNNFYACVVLCLITVEAFPAYMLCCELCACSYCCPEKCIW